MRGHHIARYTRKGRRPNGPAAGKVPSVCEPGLNCPSDGRGCNIPQFHTSSESEFPLECSPVNVPARKFRQPGNANTPAFLNRFTCQVFLHGQTAYRVENMHVRKLLTAQFGIVAKSCLTTYAS
jgi:hypothetical protein